MYCSNKYDILNTCWVNVVIVHTPDLNYTWLCKLLDTVVCIMVKHAYTALFKFVSNASKQLNLRVTKLNNSLLIQGLFILFHVPV